MDNLYLFNTIEEVGKAHTYIGSRKGPIKLEDVKLSLVHPFYNEKTRFCKQIEIWKGWPDYIRDKVNIIIIDDGSPNPIHNYITPKIEDVLSKFNFSIYRIQQNLKWNTPGALNLGLTVAPSDWVLIMDSDCAFDAKNIEILLKADPEVNSVYHFPRQRIGKEGDDLENRRYLPCTKLFHRSIFMDKLGGFDEDFTGEYSKGWAFFDSDFDSRIFKGKIPFYIWNNVKAFEWMPSIINNEILRRTKKEENINRKLFYQKQAEREVTKNIKNSTPILRFDWKLVYSRKR